MAQVNTQGSIAVEPSGGADSGTAFKIEFDDPAPGQSFSDVLSLPEFPISTSGQIGAAFVDLTLPGVLQRLFIQSLDTQDFVIRYDGAGAVVVGLAGSYGTIVNTDGFDVTIDGGTTVSVSFETGDTTLTKIVQRINAFAGAIIAKANGTVLELDGVLSGGLESKGLAFMYGSIVLADRVPGTLAKLGLVVGTTYGSGRDLVCANRHMHEPSTSTAPVKRVQVSGRARLQAVFAGRAA